MGVTQDTPGNGERLKLPKDVDWFFWRLATHPKLRDGLATIHNDWTYEDCLHAHDVLDALETAEERAHRRAKLGKHGA